MTLCIKSFGQAARSKYLVYRHLFEGDMRWHSALIRLLNFSLNFLAALKLACGITCSSSRWLLREKAANLFSTLTTSHTSFPPSRKSKVFVSSNQTAILLLTHSILFLFRHETLDIAENGKTVSLRHEPRNWDLVVGNAGYHYSHKFWCEINGVRNDKLNFASKAKVGMPDVIRSETLPIYSDHVRREAFSFFAKTLDPID